MTIIVQKNAFPHIAKRLLTGSKLAEEVSAKHIAVRARARAPRLTGKLAASIHADGNEVVADDPVGLYQEYGTVKMEANPFFVESVEEEGPRFEAAVFGLLRG
jgi:hypothetical protein